MNLNVSSMLPYIIIGSKLIICEVANLIAAKKGRVTLLASDMKLVRTMGESMLGH